MAARSSWFQRLILPALVTGLVSGSVITRFVRSSVLEALGSDHVRTAQAKGLPERQVFGWHVLRNALLPVVTVIGLQAGAQEGFFRPGQREAALVHVEAPDQGLVLGPRPSCSAFKARTRGSGSAWASTVR